MREILNLQFGQCGNNIGTKFWEIISSEHGINSSNGIYEGESDLQLLRANVFFNDGSCGKYVPRSIMVDLDSSTVDHIKNSSIGRLFQPDHFISGRASASNNYAKGFYTDGAELLDQIMELVRIEVESCDMLQGFQIFHSLGGGTGSGLTALVLSKIREEWPDRVISTLSIVPSPKISEVVVEPYNCVLGAHNLSMLSDETYCIDNEALHRICRNNLKLINPTNEDLNHIIGNTVAGITTCFRFPGQLNADLRKLAVNMVPFPRLHFFIPGFAPLVNRNNNEFVDETNVVKLINNMFNEKNMLADCNPHSGKYLTVATVFRGRVSTKEVEETMMKMRNKNESLFVDWIPSNTQTAVCDIPPRGYKVSATFIANNTAIRSTFMRVCEQFDAMYRRQAFIHWYVGEGCEKSEFENARESLSNMLEEYQSYELNMDNEDGEDAQNPESQNSYQIPQNSPMKNSSKSSIKEASLDKTLPSKSSGLDNRAPSKSSFVENKFQSKSSVIDNRAPSKSSVIDNKPPLKSSVIDNKAQSKSSVIDNKAQSKSSVIDNKAQSKSSVIDNKPSSVIDNKPPSKASTTTDKKQSGKVSISESKPQEVRNSVTPEVKSDKKSISERKSPGRSRNNQENLSNWTYQNNVQETKIKHNNLNNDFDNDNISDYNNMLEETNDQNSRVSSAQSLKLEGDVVFDNDINRNSV